MKKRYLVLMVSILVLLFGCGGRNHLTETKNTYPPEKTDIAKEIYWEKKKIWGFRKPVLFIWNLTKIIQG